MTEAAVPPTDLKDTLEEMRASVAGEAVRARLDAMVQKAILRLLEVILALLADYRAWKLARAAVVEAAADDAVAARSPRSTGSGSAARGAGRGWLGFWGWWRGKNGAGEHEAAEEDCASRAVAYPSPSRIGSHFCEQKWEPATGPSLSHKGRGIQETPRGSASSAVEADLAIAAVDSPLREAAACAAVVGYARHA